MHHAFKVTLRSSAAALALFAAAGAVSADVTITSALVDAYASSLSGRQGSVESGTDDPLPTGQNAGMTILHAFSGSGPVAPGQISSTPGTAGEVRAHGYAIESIYPASLHPSGYVIDLWLNAFNSFDHFDGGSYSGSAQGSFSIGIDVTTPTPYTLTGECNFDDENFLGYAQITGGGGMLYFAPGPAGGPPGRQSVNITGTLGVGSHTFQGDVTVGETNPTSVPFSERGTQRLHLVLGSVVPPCQGDVGKQGGLPGPDGLRDNNDFVVFIDFFFTQNPIADFGKQGGLPGSDDLYDNNDFVVFIAAFFAAC
jgi:hypothetical protein